MIEIIPIYEAGDPDIPFLTLTHSSQSHGLIGKDTTVVFNTQESWDWFWEGSSFPWTTVKSTEIKPRNIKNTKVRKNFKNVSDFFLLGTVAVS